MHLLDQPPDQPHPVPLAARLLDEADAVVADDEDRLIRRLGALQSDIDDVAGVV